MHHVFETHKRTLLKTLSWKLIATIISFFVSYAHTGSFEQATKTSLTIAAIGLVAYYLHERLWNRVHWEKHVKQNH